MTAPAAERWRTCCHPRVRQVLRAFRLPLSFPEQGKTAPSTVIGSRSAADAHAQQLRRGSPIREFCVFTSTGSVPARFSIASRSY